MLVWGQRHAPPHLGTRQCLVGVEDAARVDDLIRLQPGKGGEVEG